MATIAAWFLVIFATAALVSDTWADLVGLFYLLASPLVDRVFGSVVHATSGRADVGQAVSVRPGDGGLATRPHRGR